jgi:LysM repeat protein
MFCAFFQRRLLPVLGAAFLLAGCFPPPESNADEQRDPHYLSGRRRAESQDHQGAIEEFEKALEVNPRNSAAHFELGVLYENDTKDYAAAIYHYRRLLQLRPASESAEKAKERVNVCMRELAGVEFLPPTTQVIQKQLDRLTLENRFLQQQVATLQAQLKERAAAPVQAAPAPAPSVAASGSPGVRAVPPAAANGGNPAPVAVPAPPRPAAYVVVSGDTLERIARKYKIKLAKLEAANPNVEVHRLKVGQKLVIPPP